MTRPGSRLLCLLRGHPGFVETTIRIPEGAFGQQYAAKGGQVPVEYRAAMLNGRAFRCVRCRKGTVTEANGHHFIEDGI